MKRIRDAQTIIGSLEGGETAAELSTTITETLAYLRDHCGGRPKAKAKGKVTLTIDIEVEGNNAVLTAEIAVKKPKRTRSSSFFWVLEDGSLSTEHPSQADMFASPREVRSVIDA